VFEELPADVFVAAAPDAMPATPATETGRHDGPPDPPPLLDGPPDPPPLLDGTTCETAVGGTGGGTTRAVKVAKF